MSYNDPVLVSFTRLSQKIVAGDRALTKLRAAEAVAARRLGESFGPLRGLPIRLQAIGPYLEDRTPITFAALLAQAPCGFVPPPGYDA